MRIFTSLAKKIKTFSPPCENGSKILEECINILFSSKIYTTNRLSINVYKTFKYGKNNMPYCNVQGSKKWKFEEFWPLIKHGPHWINFKFFLLPQMKKRNTLDTCIKFGRNVFHLSWKKKVKSRRGIRCCEGIWRFAKS